MKKRIIAAVLISLIFQAFVIIPSYAADYSPELGLDAYAEYLKVRKPESTVTVAVIDSGVADVEAVRGRLCGGYDFIDGDTDTSNDIAKDSHGTFIASVIAAVTDGLPVDIMPVRILESKDVTVDNLVKGIRYAVDNGADILNISIGGEVDDCSEIDRAITYADEKGATVIVAAGNAKKEIKTYCPAHNEIAITVSSVTADKVFASYSNYGDSVDCCAPGTSVDGFDKTGAFITESGTSFSAAYISAGAAMIKLRHGDYTPARIQDEIKSVCVDLGEEGKDKYYGCGMPDFSLLIPSSAAIAGYTETAEVPYYSKLILRAETDLTFEPDIRWFVNGEYHSEGETFETGKLKDGFEVYFEASDGDGTVIRSETETVNVRRSVFDRFIAFIKLLFNIETVIEQK